MDLQIAKNQADVQAEEQAKKQANANAVIQAIEQIDEANLSAYDVTVEKVRAQYEALSDDEKALVTNVDKLERCEQIVASSRTTQYDTWIDLYNNAPIYEGTWGNFGAHVDYYQGVIEQAIKNTMTMSDYFAGDPNDVYISVYHDGGRLKSETDPVCYIELSGPKELYYDESGQIEDSVGLHIWGDILVDENGNVIFEITDMQEAG